VTHPNPSGAERNQLDGPGAEVFILAYVCIAFNLH